MKNYVLLLIQKETSTKMYLINNMDHMCISGTLPLANP